MRSEICPYIEGEDPKARHWRRLGCAIDYRHELEEFASAVAMTIEVKSGGQHWILLSEDGDTRVEWWPSSGLLVFNQQWKRRFKAHDVRQVIGTIRRRLGLH